MSFFDTYKPENAEARCKCRLLWFLQLLQYFVLSDGLALSIAENNGPSGLVHCVCVDDSVIPKLATALQTNKKVTENFLSNEALEALKDGLLHGRLESLAIHYNAVGCSAVVSVNNVCRLNWFLTKLDLSYNSISTDGAADIADVLRLNKGLLTLILHGNQITELGCQKIAVALKFNEHLTELDLGSNPLEDNGGYHLAFNLAKQTTLKRLSLYNADFGHGSQTRVELGRMLKENTTLEALDLSACRLNCDGIKHLASGLASNTTLKSLYIRGNFAEDDGLDELCTAITNHPALTELNAAANCGTVVCAARFAEVLAKNVVLKSLDLCANGIGQVGAEAIHTILQSANSTLTTLWMEADDITTATLHTMYGLVKQHGVAVEQHDKQQQSLQLLRRKHQEDKRRRTSFLGPDQ